MGKRLKLLYIGTFTGYWVSDSYRLTGFKSVFNVKDFDYREISDITMNSNAIFNTAVKFVPDIIFINKGERIHQLIIKRIKSVLPNTKIFLFNGDQRGKIQDDAIRLGSQCDALLINNICSDQWKAYKDKGIKKIFEYHTATDTDFYVPIKNSELKYDIIFAGGHYVNTFPLSKMRFDLLRELSKKFNVAIAGSNNWQVVNTANFVGRKYGAEFVKFANTAKIILGISAFDQIENYTSNRTWNSMAIGKPYLCHRYKGCDNFFTDMENIVFFDNINYCVERVSEILKNYDKFKVIGMNGRRLVMKEHTYKHRAQELLEIYKEICND